MLTIIYKLKRFLLFIVLVINSSITYYAPLTGELPRIAGLAIGLAVIISAGLFLMPSKVKYKGWASLPSYLGYFAGIAILLISNISWGIYAYVYRSFYIWSGAFVILVCIFYIIKWWRKTTVVLNG